HGGQHLGGVRRLRREGSRRRRLRDARSGAPEGAQGATGSRYRHRRHPPAHDRRGAANPVPPFLGRREDRGPREGHPGRARHPEAVMTETPPAAPRGAGPSPEPTSLSEVFWYFLKLGWLAFGGPVGQIGLMHLQVVERRKWI